MPEIPRAGNWDIPSRDQVKPRTVRISLALGTGEREASNPRPAQCLPGAVPLSQAGTSPDPGQGAGGAGPALEVGKVGVKIGRGGAFHRLSLLPQKEEEEMEKRKRKRKE